MLCFPLTLSSRTALRITGITVPPPRAAVAPLRPRLILLWRHEPGQARSCAHWLTLA